MGRSGTALAGFFCAAIVAGEGTAGATTYTYLIPASGWVHQTSGDALWSDQFVPKSNDVNNRTDRLQIRDGRVLWLLNAGFGPPSTISVTWDTPIPLSTTTGLPVTWAVVARGTSTNGGTNGISNRICTFDIVGNFFACGDPGGFDSLSSAVVPNNGNAYSQTTITAVCNGTVQNQCPIPCNDPAKCNINYLSGIRAWMP